MSASATVQIQGRQPKALAPASLVPFRRKVYELPPGVPAGANNTAAQQAVLREIVPLAQPVTQPIDTPIELDEHQREKLLLDHLPQVQYIARCIHDRLPPQVLLEDLVHAGILGLMDAVRKYNPKKNVQLKYYAEFRIRGGILDSLRQADWSPRALRRHGRRVEQAILDCKARLGRDPGEQEIAAELNIGLENLQRLLGDLRSLDIGSLEPDSKDQNNEHGIQIPTSADADPYHQALRSERTALLEKVIGELPARQRQVLALYHFKELTMKEIGAALGIGESRVSQIHTAALVRLRGSLRDLLDEKQRFASSILPLTAAAQRAEAAAARSLWKRSF